MPLNHDELLEKASSIALRIYIEQSKSNTKNLTDSEQNTANDKELQKAFGLANSALTKSSVKQAICAALSSASGDIKEVTKTAGAALLPLIAAGVIQLPLSPLVFAVVGVVVVRMGIASYCRDVEKDIEC